MGIELMEHFYTQKGKKKEFQTMKEVFSLAFAEAKKMLLQTTIDANFSGSTVVVVLILGNKLFTGNVGDSRAILGRLSKNNA